jgi:RNA polymerase sigma-70 factor (ECF subfamily)
MPPMTDDAELERMVDEVRSGEERAFARLVQRVYGRVRAWARRYTADEDDADDVAQEVIIALQRRVTQYRGESRFTSWLFTMTRRTALSRQRKQARRDALHVCADIPDSTSDRRPSLDEQTVAELVLSCFEALPPKQRLLFERVDLRGESAADVARELGMSPATARVHLFKARRSIRARMMELHEPLVKEFLS